MVEVSHPNLSGVSLHEDKRVKQPARAASTGNIALSAPGATMDGVTLASGDRLLLKDQTTASQNGIYVWTGASALLTRAPDAASASDFGFGFQVYIREGTSNGAKYWLYTQSAGVSIGTTALTFAVASAGLTDPTSVQGDIIVRGASTLGVLAIGATGSIPVSNGTTLAYQTAPTLAGEVTAKDFKPSGLTGAVAATRWVGATVSGAPATGTFSVGDFVIDQTAKIWVCTGAGTPGTWGQAGGGMSNPMTANQDLIVAGASGTPNRLAVGANDRVLGITAGVVGWINNPAGFVNPMTSPGDMITGATSGAPTRLANGANQQVLTMVGGLPGWANPAGGGGGVTNNVTSALYLARTCL